MCKFIKYYSDDCVKMLDVNVNDDKQIINAMSLFRADNITFIFEMGDSQLAVPIIYTLLWSEYNYRHALQLSKVPR